MKKIIQFSLVVLLSINGYSQGTEGKYQKLLQSAFLHPGDTVTRFRGMLVMQNDTSKEIINTDTISAKGTYSFLPALNDSIEFGTVKFKHVFVQTNADRKIVVVGLTKTYTKKSGMYTRESIQQEYDNLVAYLNAILKLPSVPYEHQSRMMKKDGKTAVPHTTRGLTWKTDTTSYRIYLDEMPEMDNTTNILGKINVNAWKSN